jgi:hypothetical protein
MNQEQQQTPINGEEPTVPRRRKVPRPHLAKPHLPKPRVPTPHLSKPETPEPLAGALFLLQEKVLWPLQDRLMPTGGPRPSRRLVVGGGLGAVAIGAVAAVVALSGGGSSTATSTSVAIEAAAAPRVPLTSAPAEPAPKKVKPAGPTLHGPAPVFAPAPRSRRNAAGETKTTTAAGDEKLGSSQKVEAPPAPSAGQSAAAEATAGTTTLSSPASATISSNPKSSKPAPAATDARAAAGTPATLPEGPPAGPQALKVARQFAKGFVVYETGGEEGEFKEAFGESATPELTKALMQRPPRQPDGVKVPRAKVLNVVAGPSQGTVYKVSVSLLRVGVTSELRLDMEKLKRGEWRVTNVLG